MADWIGIRLRNRTCTYKSVGIHLWLQAQALIQTEYAWVRIRLRWMRARSKTFRCAGRILLVNWYIKYKDITQMSDKYQMKIHTMKGKT